MTGTLREQGYSRLGRVGKGLVRRYIAKMTGRSRAQVTRLIGQFTEQGDVKVKERGATGFGLATARRTSGCWLWWMKPMTRSAVRRRRRFSTGDFTSLPTFVRAAVFDLGGTHLQPAQAS